MLFDFDGTPSNRFMRRFCDRYCYLGGGSSSQQQQQQSQNTTSSNTVDPAEMAMYEQNYGTAQTAANSLTPYTGQLTAGFTPAQTQAQGILTGIATDPSYTAGNTAAVNSVSGILANPTNTTVTPQTIAGTNLAPYENPYTSDVINATNTQIAQQRGEAQVADNAKASAAGAFGGSRSGVANALTNQYYDQDTAATDAGLNQANYSQAQTAAATDAATANNAQQESITNKLAQNGLTVNAAGQVVALNNANLGDAAAQAGILSSVGDAQQAQQQTELANAYQAYLAGQQLTVTQQQLLNSALGLVPVQQTVASSGSGSGTTNTQTQTNPGLGGILGGLGSIGSGLGAMGVVL